MRSSPPAFAAAVLCGLLVAPPVAGQEASSKVPAAREGAAESGGSGEPGICALLNARIDQLPAPARRRADGEDREGWRERVIAEVEVEATLAAEAEAHGVPLEPEWRDRFARRRAARLLRALESSFGEGISIEPEEVEVRFSTNPERFRSPEKIATSFILLDLPPDATPESVDEARRRLLEIRAEFTAGERFGALARRYSAAENAASGGAVAASPRGALLAAYEDVAWSLAPGEVSEPFRLPDGMAILRLEHLFPARELSLDEARPRIEKRLVWEATQTRREAAVEEARARWPATVDWPDGAAVPREIRFAGEVLGLADLGLENRPPRLLDRLTEELDRRQLARLAEQRGLAQRSPTAEALAALRLSMLAAVALERRLQPLVPEPTEAELRAFYEQDTRRFPDPERRTFEVLFLPGEEGALRPAREEAERQAALWRGASPPAALETWGPLARSEIGSATSPRLAEIAFSLSAGEVSEPVRLENYRAETARFVVEGYVVLRLLEMEPASILPFEAVSERLADYVGREAREAVARAVRAEIAAGLDLGDALERYESCTLHEPLSRRGRTERDGAATDSGSQGAASPAR